MQNKSQIEFWNGDTGRNWVAHDALMEAMLQPIGETVLDAFRFEPHARALDIGCGCGHPTLSLADADRGWRIRHRRRYLRARCWRWRVSSPQRVHPIGLVLTFLEVDAQVHPFEPASVEHVFSRFGVMFFEDPVAAFRNLHRCPDRLRDAGLLLLAIANSQSLYDGACPSGLRIATCPS